MTVRIECRACQRPTNAFLCTPCSDDLERAFGDLPGLVDALVDSLARLTRIYRSARQPGTVDEDWRSGDDALEAHPLPVDLAAGPLITQTGNTLTTWARHLAEVRGLRFAPAVEGPACVRCSHGTCLTIRAEGNLLGPIDTPARVAAITRWLLRNINAIRYDEAAGEMHAEILALREQLRRFVDRSPSPFFAGPCHHQTVDAVSRRTRCERDLYAWINPFAIDTRDNPTVTCNGYRSRVEGDRGCGAVHTLADRYEWLVASVDDALLPLVTWQQALPKMFPGLTWPNRSTWWRWTSHEDESKRRLLPKSIDRSGVELFRGGDIVDLVQSEQARIRGNAGKNTLDKRSA